jgi:hypothetical protein
MGGSAHHSLAGSTAAASSEPSLLGNSVGYFEGDSHVIETTYLAPNVLFTGKHATSFSHSGELRIVGRYEKTNNGERLELSATIQDPVILKQPLEIWKSWAWSPGEEIFEYSCVVEPG